MYKRLQLWNLNRRQLQQIEKFWADNIKVVEVMKYVLIDKKKYPLSQCNNIVIIKVLFLVAFVAAVRSILMSLFK